MRANHRTLAALDADLRVPRRNFQSQVPLLPFRGARGERAVAGEYAHRKLIAAAGVDGAQNVVFELRGSRECSRDFCLAADALGNLYFKQLRQRRVDSLHVLLHHVFALAAVSMANGLADRFDGFVARQNFRDGEKADLHDRVRTRSHASVLRDLVGVDGVEFRLLGDELRLYFPRQVVPQFIFPKRTVDQEYASRYQSAEHVVTLKENPLVAGDEVRFGHQITGVDGLRSEAQVRNRHRAGFFRVVNKVSLPVIVGVLADDLDGVLVSAHRAVRAETIEQSADHAVRLGRERGIIVEAGVADVVLNANREVIFRLALLQVVLLQIIKDGLHHRRSEFLGRQAVASADHAGRALQLSVTQLQPLMQRVHYVEVEWLADRSRLFGAVENGNLANAGGEGFHERLHAEGPVQADFQQAHFFSACTQVFDRFVRGLCAGTHRSEERRVG